MRFLIIPEHDYRSRAACFGDSLRDALDPKLRGR